MNLKRLILGSLASGLFVTGTAHATEVDHSTTEQSQTSNAVANQKKEAHQKGTSDNDAQWQLAKKAGYTKAQFEKIMSMPDFSGYTKTTQQVSRAINTANMTDQQRKVVQTAQAQLGIPYVWGGTSPQTGFDCSGLVQYVYKKAVNYNLPRVTTDQQNVGKPVSIYDTKPGDLVFYGYPSSYHVAICVGDNDIIQAPQPGQVVQQIDMNYFMPNHARRILDDKPKPTKKLDEYRVVTAKSGNVWNNLDLTEKRASMSQYYDQVIHLKYYYKYQGKNIYSAYDKNDKWIGYFTADTLSETTSPGGNYHSLGKYVSVKKDNYTLWKDLNFSKKKGNSKDIYRHTVKAKGYYKHFNGSTYYSLYDKDNNWLGYINANGVKETKETGCHYAESGYVTIPNTEGTTYSNVALTKPKTNYKQYALTTVQIQGVYYRFDGTAVYSLYDKNDQWIGYISSDQLERVTSPGGSYQSLGKYVSVKKDNYTLWKDLDFNKKKGNSKDIYRHTVKAKGYYKHFNGSTYYSLYDKNNKWLGYINANGVKEAKETGCHYAESGYVTIPHSEGTTYSNVALTKPKTEYKQYALKTVQIQGVYYRFDGTTVYSLYDNNDQWIGYISSNQPERVTSPGGSYQSYGKKVTVEKNNYPMWRTLDFTSKKGTSAPYYKKTYLAKGRYFHYNGSIYYSLYDDQGKWLGYINGSGLKVK